MKQTELTSREIVKRCIEFRSPPRLAMSFATMPIKGKVWKFTDFAGVSSMPDPDFLPSREGETEWGYVMQTYDPTGENMGQVKEHPLAEGWHLLDSYRFPDFAKPARYAHLKDQVSELHTQGKYVYGSIPALTQVAINLRGMENWLVDHLIEPENLGVLLDRITDIRLKIIDEMWRAGVDGVITWDDMGTNDRVFISPHAFRKIYFPRYKRATSALHERGMHFIHHCCGFIREYMDMFVEGGCDVLQLDQPTLTGIDWLSKNYGGKICFWNCVDIQTTALKTNPAEIEDEAHHLVWALGKYDGGFMVKAYHQPNSIGITVAIAEAQYRAFLKYASYPLTPYPGNSPLAKTSDI